MSTVITPMSQCPPNRSNYVILITLATKDTEETLRDAQSCAPSRFENFLRDGGQHRLGCCGKGLDVVAPASLKAKSKNAGIGTRTQDLAVQSPESPSSFDTKGCSKGILGISTGDSNPGSFATTGCSKGIS